MRTIQLYGFSDEEWNTFKIYCLRHGVKIREIVRRFIRELIADSD